MGDYFKKEFSTTKNKYDSVFKCVSKNEQKNINIVNVL